MQLEDSNKYAMPPGLLIGTVNTSPAGMGAAASSRFIIRWRRVQETKRIDCKNKNIFYLSFKDANATTAHNTHKM